VLADPEAAGKVFGERNRLLPKHKIWIALIVGIFLFIGISTLFINQKKLEKTSIKTLSDPSIAVLPFTNLTGDPAKEIICDGLSEDIINTLSKMPKIIVIASHSTFFYKGKSLSVQELGKELNARYLLEGNVRRADDRLRVSAQLIDAAAGKNIWAETYDRQFDDLFVVQEEITFNIISALQIKLTEGLQAKLWQKKAKNFEAYSKLMQGLEHFRKFNKEDNRLARELYEEAIAIDQEYAGAYRTLAWTHWADARFGFSKSPSKSMEIAEELAQKTIGLDDQDPGAFYLLAGIHLLRKEHDFAVSNILKASEMDPNAADILGYKALCLNYAGKPTEALASIQKAMRLNPHYPGWYDQQLGLSYHLIGDHVKALESFKKMRERIPNSFLPRGMLVICYMNLNREADAKVEVAEILQKIRPDFSTALWEGVQPYKDQRILEKELEALRNAGVPD